MSDGTKIEWTEATWNPITGCSLASPGCTNCYAMQLAGTRLAHHPSREGLTRESGGRPKWTGEVRFNEQWLADPLKWKRPRMIFVCAHGDLFHENVPDAWIDRVFAVMALCPQHTFQVLTKRSARMREYVSAFVQGRRSVIAAGSGMAAPGKLAEALGAAGDTYPACSPCGPLPNVWLGVSVEDQQRADERIPDLLATPAAVRWLSCEPLLGPVDLNRIRQVFDGGLGHSWESALNGKRFDTIGGGPDIEGCPKIDWVVAGGESGLNARPMHPDWARSLRDQCAAAGVPFFFKQRGNWTWREADDGTDWAPQRRLHRSGILSPIESDYPRSDEIEVANVGKKRAGRLLDGVEHNNFPTAKGA